MAETAYEVRWGKKRFLLVGTLQEGGPICTRTEYKRGDVSTAHLYASGAIKCYGKIVGHRDELALGKRVPLPKHNKNAFARVLQQLGL